MLALYLTSLRRMALRPGSVALSVCGIALGVALVTALNLSLASIDASIRAAESVDAGTGAGMVGDGEAIAVTARSPRGFEADLLPPIADEPAVTGVVAQIRTPVMADGQPVLLIGDGRVPSPLAGSSLDDGQSIEVVTTAGSTSLAVSAAPGVAADINGGDVIYLPLEQAQAMTGRPGMIDQATVSIGPHDDGDGNPNDHTRDVIINRLQGALGPSVHVAPAEQEREFANAQLRQIQSPVLLMSIIALMAGSFLVFNTIQSSARQQERDLAVLRAIGATGRQVAIGFLLEALIMGLAGSLVGLAAGTVVGYWLVGQLPDLVATLAGTRITYRFDPQVVAIALLLGPVVSVLAAVIPIRRALRHRPSRVLAQHGLSPVSDRPTGDGPWPGALGAVNLRVTAIGLAVLAVGGLAVTAPSMAISQNGLGLLLGGFLTVGYGCRHVLGRMAAALAGRFGSLGSIVEADLGQARARVWSTIAAVVAALIMGLAIGGAARNQVSTVDEHFELTADTDLWVATAGGDDLGLAFAFEADAVDQVARLDAVEAVVPLDISFVTIGDKRVLVGGVGGDSSLPSFRLADPGAQRSLLRDEGAIITVQLARVFDLEVGDEFSFDGATGPNTVTILDITETIAPSTSGTLLLSWPRYTSTVDDDRIDTFEVHAAEGADLEALTSKIEGILAGPTPVVVLPGPAWADGVVSATREAANVFMVVVTVVIVIAGLAILNATASSVVERQRLLGVLRAVGATPAQIRRLVVIEVVCAGAVGTVLGVAGGVLMHRVAVYITNNTTPFPEEYAFSWASLAQGLGSAVVAVLAGGIIPARQQARRRMADILAYE